MTTTAAKCLKAKCTFCGRKIAVNGLGIPNVTPWLNRHLAGKGGRAQGQDPRGTCMGSNIGVSLPKEAAAQ